LSNRENLVILEVGGVGEALALGLEDRIVGNEKAYRHLYIDTRYLNLEAIHFGYIDVDAVY
jgi:hypothetical protein